MRTGIFGLLLCAGLAPAFARTPPTSHKQTETAPPVFTPIPPGLPRAPAFEPGLPAEQGVPVPSPLAANWYVEARGGILEHDVRGLWSGNSVESGEDANLELLSRPLRLHTALPGGLRFQLGGSANNSGDTSKAYAGFIYEFESEGGLFFNAGLGAATHDGELRYRGSRYLNLDQAPGRRTLYLYYYVGASVAFLSLDHNRKELGSRTLFRIPFEAGFALHDSLRVSFLFDHISNGYLARPNEGLDTLGFRIGIRI